MKRTFESEMVVIEIKGLIKETEHLLQNGRFNLGVDNVEDLKEEYKDKPESNYLSYSRLLQLSDEARDLAKFRMNGLAYEKFLPYSSPDNQYTKQNLDYKLDSLLNNVNDTIFILKNLE